MSTVAMEEKAHDLLDKALEYLRLSDESEDEGISDQLKRTAVETVLNAESWCTLKAVEILLSYLQKTNKK